MNKQILNRYRFLMLVIFLLASFETFGYGRNWNIVSADIDGNKQDDVIINFGSAGVWAWMNNTNWNKLHSSIPKAMVAGDLDGNGKSALIFDFAPNGIWILKNQTSWTKLHDLPANNMVMTDLDANGKSDLVIDFGVNNGIWIWKNSSVWSQLHPSSAKAIAVGNLDTNPLPDVVINFGNDDVWSWMNSNLWVTVTYTYNRHCDGNTCWQDSTRSDNALEMTTIKNGTGAGYLLIDSLLAGVDLYFYWDNAANNEYYIWGDIHVHDLSPSQMLAVDLDGNGLDDVVFNFGQSGIWVKMNNSTWVNLHNASAGEISFADIDGNGKQDLIIDFLKNGIWLYMNNQNWVLLHPASPTLLNTYPNGSGVIPHKDIDVNPTSNASIEFTSVPAIGSTNLLEGRVLNVTDTTKYKVATYINVAAPGGWTKWWTKPYWTLPLTNIEADGTWKTNITTGGVDTWAPEIAAFLVPADYNPPQRSGEGEMPSELNAFPKVSVNR